MQKEWKTAVSLLSWRKSIDYSRRYDSSIEWGELYIFFCVKSVALQGTYEDLTPIEGSDVV